MEARIKKQIAELTTSREQILANLNYVNGRLEGLRALLEPEPVTPEPPPEKVTNEATKLRAAR